MKANYWSGKISRIRVMGLENDSLHVFTRRIWKRGKGISGLYILIKLLKRAAVIHSSSDCYGSFVSYLPNCTQSPVLDQVVRGCAKEVSALAANISFPASWRSFDTTGESYVNISLV